MTATFTRGHVIASGHPIASYAWRGAGTAGCCLFLHGLGVSNGAHAVDMAEILCGHYGVDVIAVDLPGFGESPVLPAELYRTRDLVQLLDAAVGQLTDQPPCIIGHSWGGYLACHLAAYGSGDHVGLVLLDGGYYDLPARPYEELLSRAVEIDANYRFASLDDLITYECSGGHAMSEAVQAAYRTGMMLLKDRYAMRQRPELAARINLESARAPVSETHELLRDTRLPTLLLIPESGSAAVDEPRTRLGTDLVESLPAATLGVISGASHFVLKNAGREIGHRVGRWLAGVTNAPIVETSRAIASSDAADPVSRHGEEVRE